MSKQKTYTIREALQKMQIYCAYRERCHKEVIEKLRSMNMISSSIDVIMGDLIESSYLNEARFAQAFVQGKFRIKKWGRLRIKRELMLREISSINMRRALAQINEEEYRKTLDELSAKRFGQLKESNILKARKKLADYLLYRGWESGLVYEKVCELIP